jgi:hypothetical protein
LALCVEFPEDGEGFYADGLVSVILKVFENALAEGIPYRTGELDQHGFRETSLEHLAHFHRMLLHERRYVLERGPETKGPGKFQEEAYVIVGIIGLQGIEGKDAPYAPLIESVFYGAFPDGTEKDLREK